MNILVTGSNGQLGSELRYLSESNNQFNFYFTDVAELDITKAEEVSNFVKNNNINTIINCAAYTAVDKAESDAEMCIKINVSAPEILAKICAEQNAILVHISTDFVFDGTSSIPYTEDINTAPLSAYGATKRDGEIAIEKYANKYIIIRTSWLYSSFGANFVKTMQKYGRERESLNVIFDQIGTPTYARNLADTILKCIAQYDETKKGIYHYSNEGVASWYDFAFEIMNLSNIECKIHPIETVEYPTPAVRPKYSVLNKKKIKSTFGIEISHWKESLSQCINLLKETNG
jgi:dTDP-4-dehydrorhamnose reductase